MARTAASGRTGVGDWTDQYEGNVLPVNDDPAWDRQGAATPDTEEIVSGTLHLAHSTYSGYERSLTIIGDCTLEMSVKLVGGVIAFDMGNENLQAYYAVFVKVGQIQLNGETSSLTYSMTTTDDFHTYRLHIKNNVAYLYVDGVLVLIHNDSGGGFGGYYSIWANTDQNGDGYYDYVYCATDGSFPRFSASSRTAASSRVSI